MSFSGMQRRNLCARYVALACGPSRGPLLKLKLEFRLCGPVLGRYFPEWTAPSRPSYFPTLPRWHSHTCGVGPNYGRSSVVCACVTRTLGTAASSSWSQTPVLKKSDMLRQAFRRPLLRYVAGTLFNSFMFFPFFLSRRWRPSTRKRIEWDRGAGSGYPKNPKVGATIGPIRI